MKVGDIVKFKKGNPTVFSESEELVVTDVLVMYNAFTNPLPIFVEINNIEIFNAKEVIVIGEK